MNIQPMAMRQVDGPVNTMARLFSKHDSQLRRAARRILRRGTCTLQDSHALVSETFLRIAHCSCAGDDEFMALARRVMRSIVVDDLRRNSTLKRGGAVHHNDLYDEVPSARVPDEDVGYWQLLRRLGKDDLAVCFALWLWSHGYTQPEIAALMGVSVSSVYRRIRKGKRWYRQFISDETESLAR